MCVYTPYIHAYLEDDAVHVTLTPTLTITHLEDDAVHVTLTLTLTLALPQP